MAADDWAPGSWKSKPAKQLVTYPDEVALASTLAQITKLPPLVSVNEINGLRQQLAEVAEGKRFALPNSRVMIHQPSGGAQGSAADVEIQAREILFLRQRLNEAMSEATGQPIERIEGDMERDFFMSAEGAKEYGVIDEILDRRADTAV